MKFINDNISKVIYEIEEEEKGDSLGSSCKMHDASLQFSVYSFQFLEKRKDGSDKSDPYIWDYTILQYKKKG